MSDSIKNKITRACQCTGYKTVAYSAGSSVGTNEVSSINIPWSAIVTDVVVIPTTAFTNASSGTTHALVGTAAGTVYNQADDSAGTADPDGFLAGSATTGSLGTVGKRVSAAGPADESIAGVLLGTKPPYSLAQSYTEDDLGAAEDKIVPVTLSFKVTTGAATAGEVIWWVEYMFPSNIVWDQASI